MENLLNPDKGLIIWTIVSFIVLVLVLSKVAWKPLLQALKEREDGIRKAIDDASSAKTSAEKMQSQLKDELAKAQDQAADLVAKAQSDAQKLREQMMKDAEAEAQRLSEQTRRQLEEEKAKLSRDLRQEVANLSIKVAEKLLKHSVDAKENEALAKGFVNDLDKESK